jgi:hypothetical protein
MVALDDLIQECGGNMEDPKIEEAISTWISEMQDDLDNKVDNYAAFITELKARSATRKAEADRLAARAKTDSNTATFLANRLKVALIELGIKKLETDRYRVSVAGNGGKQPLDIHGEVTKEFTKTVELVDRTAIREALESGKELDFAILQERGNRLSIK